MAMVGRAIGRIVLAAALSVAALVDWRAPALAQQSGVSIPPNSAKLLDGSSSAPSLSFVSNAQTGAYYETLGASFSIAAGSQAVAKFRTDGVYLLKGIF